jgi:hypothetical protein
MNLTFKIEQIAIAPINPVAARLLLNRIFPITKPWTEDTVHAKGTVAGIGDEENVADLAFNYEMMPGVEFEVLDYIEGENFVDDATNGTRNIVSHFGTHCKEEELNEWKAFFDSIGVSIVQEVWTQHHTSEYLQQKGRKYHYCIFGTRDLIGTDLKFIVRIEKDAQSPSENV